MGPVSGLRWWAWAAVAAVVVAVSAAWWLGRPAPSPPGPGPTPIVFVHGMGASAADVGTAQFSRLLGGLARDFPHPGVCQTDAQPDRPWEGSPCVFRYVEDRAEAGEPGPAGSGPNDSQSGIEENADKLARDVDQVFRRAGGRRVVVIGYSMGGTIVRAFLSLHARQADEQVAGAVLLQPVTTGSWAFAPDVRRHLDGPVGQVLAEAVSRGAAARFGVDLSRPAFRDLRPRSALLRRVAPLPVPRRVSTYTFWGDVTLSVSGRLLGRDVNATLAVGDLAALPGDPDPHALPVLGGQRFRPPDPAAGAEAVEVAHRARVEVSGAELAAIATACGFPGRADCRQTVLDTFDVPSLHWRVAGSLDTITVDPPWSGEVSLQEAIVEAVRRAQR